MNTERKKEKKKSRCFLAGNQPLVLFFCCASLLQQSLISFKKYVKTCNWTAWKMFTLPLVESAAWAPVVKNVCCEQKQ